MGGNNKSGSANVQNTRCQFPEIEEEVLRYWERKNWRIDGRPATAFQKSVEKNKDSSGENYYVYYDGPPFANGLPHYGHFVTSCIKDIIPRYQTIKGKVCERVFGWDCHGLPSEMEAEKTLGIGGRVAVREFGIDKFNNACAAEVMKYTNEWKAYINRQARWVDMENSYKTMDIDYMESVVYAFKKLYDKGLMYEAMRVVPYSWKCQTQLSNFETHLDNSYRKKKSKSVYVKFELDEVPAIVLNEMPRIKKAFILAWTTTPWTLPSNLALAVKEDIDYIVLQNENLGECYIVAKDLADKLAANKVI